MRILIVIALLRLLAGPAFAQSSQELSQDLRTLKWNYAVCQSDYTHYKRKGVKVPDLSPEQLKEVCLQRVLQKYKEQVDVEERLIEGMAKSCCPNVKQTPAPYYRERKEYKNVQTPQGGERDELERMMARLKEAMK